MTFQARKVFGSFEKRKPVSVSVSAQARAVLLFGIVTRGNYSHTASAVMINQLFELTALKSKSNQRSVRLVSLNIFFPRMYIDTVFHIYFRYHRFECTCLNRLNVYVFIV